MHFIAVANNRQQSQYGSFLRQLNYYGFRKVQCLQAGAFAFQHPYFLRDDASVQILIRRQTRPCLTSATSYASPSSDGRSTITKKKQKAMTAKREVLVSDMSAPEVSLKKARVDQDGLFPVVRELDAKTSALERHLASLRSCSATETCLNVVGLPSGGQHDMATAFDRQLDRVLCSVTLQFERHLDRALASFRRWSADTMQTFASRGSEMMEADAMLDPDSDSVFNSGLHGNAKLGGIFDRNAINATDVTSAGLGFDSTYSRPGLDAYMDADADVDANDAAAGFCRHISCGTACMGGVACLGGFFKACC